MAITLPNTGMLKAVFDAFFNGGGSMKGGKNIQDQIEDAPVAALKARIITGWVGADGKPYSTSVAQQAAFNAQGIAATRAELGAARGELGAIKEVLQQLVTSLSEGVALQIDYTKIDASIKAAMPEAPEYELTVKDGGEA